MLSEKLQSAMNDQIRKEFYSSYLYLAMAAHFEAANLPGFAHWMKAQSEEETEHGMKFYEFINDRGGRVKLQAIDQPPVEFGTPVEIFKVVVNHEEQVTASIHKLYALAQAENDYPTQVMLHWFIDEQVEEEKNANSILDMFKLAGDQGAALLMADRALGARAGD
jgi:ferritin